MSTQIKSSSYSVQERTSLKGVKNIWGEKEGKGGKENGFDQEEDAKFGHRDCEGPGSDTNTDEIQEMQKIKTQIQTQIIDARDDVFASFQNQKKLEIQKFTNTGHKDWKGLVRLIIDVQLVWCCRKSIWNAWLTFGKVSSHDQRPLNLLHPFLSFNLIFCVVKARFFSRRHNLIDQIIVNDKNIINKQNCAPYEGW